MRKTRLRHLETLIKSWDAKRQYSWRQSWQQTLRNAIVKINIVVYTNYQSPLVSFIVRHFIGDLRHRPRLYSSSSIRLGKKPMKVDGELIHTFRLVCWLSRNPFWPSFTCSSFFAGPNTDIHITMSTEKENCCMDTADPNFSSTSLTRQLKAFTDRWRNPMAVY